MSERGSLVPLSRSLVAGTAGQTNRAAGSRRDNSGTIGLKALAAKVLMRDTERDNSGTNLTESCPAAERGVGQTFAPVPQIAKPEPLLMRDGRRLWRWHAASIPSIVSVSARALADEARAFGCVLVGDGCDLLLVERWRSELPDDVREGLATNAGAIIALLRGESRVRTGETRL